MPEYAGHLLESAESIESAIAWDNHTCMPLRSLDESFLPHLNRHRKSGFTVVSLNIGFGEQSWNDHIAMADCFRTWILAHSEQYLLITDTTDIALAKKTNRLGVFFDVEGTGVIDNEPARIQILYDLGVRWMSLAYNRSNRYAGGCLPGEDTGLSREGLHLLDEMQRVGMLVCCSHTGIKTALQAIDHCKSPVIFSHSNCIELWRHPRNIPNEAIDLCAEKGGVIGVSGVGPFIQKSGADVAVFLKHVDYIAQRTGSEHVGLGLDYVFDEQELMEYIEDKPALFSADDRNRKEFPILGPESLPAIVKGLVEMGYASKDIINIIGGNFIRLATHGWKPPSTESMQQQL